MFRTTHGGAAASVPGLVLGLVLGSVVLLAGCDVVGTPTGQGLALPSPPPRSPNLPRPTREREVYEALRTGDPARAQEVLDRDWQDMTSPRNVVLYQAAIAVASGDGARAKAEIQKVRQHYSLGTGNATGVLDCNILRALAERLSDKSLDCQADPPPPWPAGGRQDPRAAAVPSGPTARPTSPRPTTGIRPTGTTRTSAPGGPGTRGTTGNTAGKPSGTTGSW
ncbi:hypothetical protein [Streptoalloteichus hindustanus]|uniref:Uncharacterized protein n=1 Tax=Streptoalloteichus hindustanus TaxID=2017 RepID=A0A1M5KUK3_STRHI|nr:hypothetical protein [Streptoalloteichus hindustanus]SHG55823.1 hypothetical protein SAMN05444320_11039 [Streptoalloteichus hindustanus]